MPVPSQPLQRRPGLSRGKRAGLGQNEGPRTTLAGSRKGQRFAASSAGQGAEGRRREGTRRPGLMGGETRRSKTHAESWAGRGEPQSSGVRVGSRADGRRLGRGASAQGGGLPGGGSVSAGGRAGGPGRRERAGCWRGARQGHEGIPRLAFHRVLCDSGLGHPSRKCLSVFTPVSGTQGDREATRTRREESAGRAVTAALTPGLELGAESAPPCGRLPGWQAW